MFLKAHRDERSASDGSRKRFGVMLVNQVPLANQQASAIEDATGGTCIVATGENYEDWHPIYLKGYDYIVFTAQSLVNLLKKKEICMDDISCIVFDEVRGVMEIKSVMMLVLTMRQVHCAKKGNHQYNQIMDGWMKTQQSMRPPLLSLSASIVSGKNRNQMEKEMRGELITLSFVLVRS